MGEGTGSSRWEWSCQSNVIRYGVGVVCVCQCVLSDASVH